LVFFERHFLTEDTVSLPDSAGQHHRRSDQSQPAVGERIDGRCCDPCAVLRPEDPVTTEEAIPVVQQHEGQINAMFRKSGAAVNAVIAALETRDC
jgi:hypothetical protein